MTVHELNSRLDQEEFVYWAAYFELDHEEKTKMMEQSKRRRAL